MSGYTEKEIIWIVLIGSSITLLLVAFLVSFVFFYQRRHFRFLREKQSIHSQFQAELLKTKLEIQEETFRSISEEIHDNIGQTLSFIKLNLNTINPVLTEKERDKWGESKELLTKVIQELRSLSRTLNTDLIQQIGLVTSVRQQLLLLEKTGLYETKLLLNGERWQLASSHDLVLYRVVQELLNNIVKHAQARTITVLMDYRPDLLVLVVADDGTGFDPGKFPAESAGLGLRNIQNRVSMIKGTLNIASFETGTTITIILPNTNEG
jgi:two-component system, NarL family, sensor kinase